ncbi:MAG: ABC transporter substrate-binding protein [Gammaproteobacteria bacterium]
MKKLLTAILLTAMALTLTPAIGQDKKKIRIGIEAAYPPFSEELADGTYKGFDIDIANALCESMKAECTLVKQEWDGMIPALMAKKFDAIVASMSITEERKQKVDFTNKYYQTPARFVRKKGSGIEINAESLKGKTVGVQKATIHEKFLNDNYGNAVTVKSYGSQDEVYLDLKAGRVDLILQDSVAAQEGFLKTEAGKDYEFVGPKFSDPKWFGEGAGIAIRKGDNALRDALNKAIDDIRANGKYKEIQDKYFDFDVYGT